MKISQHMYLISGGRRDSSGRLYCSEDDPLNLKDFTPAQIADSCHVFFSSFMFFGFCSYAYAYGRKQPEANTFGHFFVGSAAAVGFLGLIALHKHWDLQEKKINKQILA